VIEANELKLIEIFRVVLDVDDDFDVRTARRIVNANWDSLAHTSLVAAIESEFNVALESVDMERMTSYAAVKLMLEERGL
jgi:acyl carrier protein